MLTVLVKSQFLPRKNVRLKKTTLYVLNHVKYKHISKQK